MSMARIIHNKVAIPLYLIAGMAFTSPAFSGGEESVSSKAHNSTSSSAAVSATIVERPSVACSRALRAINVETNTVPRLSRDHLLRLVAPQLDCSFIGRLFGVTARTPIAGAAERDAEIGAPLRVIRTSTISSRSYDSPGQSASGYVLEVIYNFE